MQTPAFAEEAVLGGILLRNENFHDAAQWLTAEHFTSAFRSRLWEALRERILAGEPADEITVCELLPDHASDVLEIASTCMTARNVPTYVEIVRKNWRKREQVKIAQRLLAAARADEDGGDEAIGDLLRLSATVTEHEFTIKQAMHLAFEQANAAYQAGGNLPGITTGLATLDDLLGGLHKSDLTFIGARPAMGKTAFMLGLAAAAARSGVTVGVISSEQPAVQLGLRIASLASGVAAQRIRSGRLEDEDWGRLTNAVSDTSGLPLRIYDRSSVTLDELVAMARKWKHQHGLGLLLVDYAQRIRVPGADRITEVSEVGRGLKNIARAEDIPVVSLAQVKAAVDNRPDKRPTSGDLANSDELTREADQIVMLYRDEVYNPNTPDRGIAELLIEKNRHGPTGFKKVAFLAETMRFADLIDARDL